MNAISLPNSKNLLSCAISGLLLLFLAVENLWAQDASFSQYFNNQLYYNPAYTGSILGLRTRLNYRNQWHNLPSSYNNYCFSIDVAEPNIPGAGGLGVVIMSDFDGLGSIRTTSATSNFAARVQMSKRFATQFGISASYVQRSIDWNSFIFSDQIHPSYGIIGPTSFQSPDFNTVSHPDFGFGLLLQYYTGSNEFEHIIFNLSSSLQHAFQPDISFTGIGTKLPHKLVVMGDILFEFKPRSTVLIHDYIDKFNPSFIIEKHGSMTNFIIGSNFNKGLIYTGLWLRSQHFTYSRVNDLIFLAGIDIPMSEGTSLKFMYSYDYVISNLRRTVGATHEIFLVFELEDFSFLTGRSRAGTGGAPGNESSHRFRRIEHKSF